MDQISSRSIRYSLPVESNSSLVLPVVLIIENCGNRTSGDIDIRPAKKSLPQAILCTTYTYMHMHVETNPAKRSSRPPLNNRLKQKRFIDTQNETDHRI